MASRSNISIVERIVAVCTSLPTLTVALLLALAAASAVYTGGHFAMDTDSTKLISPQVDWRKREIHYDSLFPQQANLILIVVDGKTPEIAEQATADLTAKLAGQSNLFSVVRRPDGGDFFNRNGLLFLDLKEVKANTQQMIQAAPFLGPMASDPSLRGVMQSLQTALLGVDHGDAKLSDLGKPIHALGGALNAVEHGEHPFFSWRALVNDGPPDKRELQRFIQVQPRLDFGALEPGADATDAIRAAAASLHLDAAHGVRVRLTGPVPLSDEEFATLAERAWLMGAAMLAAVLLTLWLAVRSFKIIAAILTTVGAGLAMTMAAGLLAAGVFNIISIAFVALFVGLGVDFGIQYCVRYRHERFVGNELRAALKCAARSVGMPLALAAAATAVGFFSFLPTSYSGVAELGLVAGIGMIVAFVLSITLLPALLMLLNPPGESDEVGYRVLAAVDRVMISHRGQVMKAAALLGLGAAVLCSFVKFDFNPLNLRSAKTESVSTILDLMKDPVTSPNTIDVLAPNLKAAQALAARLSQVPEVGQAITVADYVPGDQPAKLAVISDADLLLDATINPFSVKPEPGDAEIVASLIATAKALHRAAEKDPEGGREAAALAGLLEKLAAGTPELRARAGEVLIPPLKTMLGQMAASLQASEVTVENMPPELVADWIAKDGTARVQVSPKDTSGSNKSLNAFSKAVMRIVPDATGTPISIRQSGTTIVNAFIQAGLLSFVAITILLLLVLRSFHQLLLTAVPLALTGVLTIGTAVAIGLQLNFANVIALPLLFGIGVAFNIYFVMAWRAGQVDLLQSSLTRAVIYSAATTASGFGSLWLSSHPGTASMGELLMISLGWTLATTLFFLPALMGKPERPLPQKSVRQKR
jgi:hopanoid biosynthesis associated RND transporter like protein HpnN